MPSIQAPQTSPKEANAKKEKRGKDSLLLPNPLPRQHKPPDHNSAHAEQVDRRAKPAGGNIALFRVSTISFRTIQREKEGEEGEEGVEMDKTCGDLGRERETVGLLEKGGRRD